MTACRPHGARTSCRTRNGAGQFVTLATHCPTFCCDGSGDGRLAYNPSMDSPRCKMATYLEAAITILREAKEPLHYKEITRRAQKKGLIEDAKTPTASISSAIVTNMKQNGNKSAFRRVGKGIYALNPSYRSKDTFKHRGKNHAIPPTRHTRFSGYVKEISISIVPCEGGEYTHGVLNKLTQFVFFEKQKTVFKSAIERHINYDKDGNPKPFPALYTLFDIKKNEVYVGETDVGKDRIDTHWHSQSKNFTHAAIVFDARLVDPKMREKLEYDLSNFFKTKKLNVTTLRVRDVPINPNDERTHRDLRESIERIADELCRLIDELPPLPETEYKFWIWPTSLDGYKTMRTHGIWASKASLEKIAARIAPSDQVAFYIPERKLFAGLYQFVGTWGESARLIWPDELESNKKIHTSQIRLRLVRDGVTSLDSVGHLEIFKNKGNRGLALRSSNGYPANNGKPIPDSDMKVIIERLRPGSL